MRAALSFALVGVVALAGASVRTRIDRQYKRWAHAAITNDVETILAILAPDYTLHTYTGKVITREAYEASLRKRKKDKKPATNYQTEIASVTVTGKVASVISNETSVNMSVDPITSKKLKLIHIHRYLDTWVRLGGSWRLQKTITQVESTKVFPVGA